MSTDRLLHPRNLFSTSLYRHVFLSINLLNFSKPYSSFSHPSLPLLSSHLSPTICPWAGEREGKDWKKVLSNDVIISFGSNGGRVRSRGEGGSKQIHLLVTSSPLRWDQVITSSLHFLCRVAKFGLTRSCKTYSC
jgi:hypothetical protein